MKKSDQGRRTQKTEIILEDLDYASVAPVRSHGGRFYLSIHPRDLAFWNIKPGDEVLVRLVKIKRASQGEAM